MRDPWQKPTSPYPTKNQTTCWNNMFLLFFFFYYYNYCFKGEQFFWPFLRLPGHLASFLKRQDFFLLYKSLNQAHLNSFTQVQSAMHSKVS